MLLRSTALLLLLLLSLDLSSEDRKRRMSIFGTKKKYRSPMRYKRPSLSHNKFKYLFPTAAALGGIYIASRMRPHVRLRSYEDLYSHTVCEGTPAILANTSTQPYRYFLCPDDPDQPFARYCCMDRTTLRGFCCSYDEKVRYRYPSRWGIVSGAIATLAVVSLVAAIVYCLCCRRRRMAEPVHTSPYPPTQPVTVGATPPYPYGKPESPFTMPYPPPNNAHPMTPQPGTGWRTHTPQPGPPPPGSGWMDAPPPPYSSVATAPYPNH